LLQSLRIAATYTPFREKYPTVNVVDTGVNLQKLGNPTSMINTTGDDKNGIRVFEPWVQIAFHTCPFQYIFHHFTLNVPPARNTNR
jgi:hypothetical protein